jgi:hypothetical protein
VSSALRRFGILECIVCGVDHEFVSYDPACDHITDAFCVECGFVYGRRSDVDFGAPPVETDGTAPALMIRTERHRVAVIDDAAAARALARLQKVAPGKADVAATTALREREAAAAKAKARAAEMARPTAPAAVADEPADEPKPQIKTPDLADLIDVEDDGSRRAAFLRSLRPWQNPSSP